MWSYPEKLVLGLIWLRGYPECINKISCEKGERMFKKMVFLENNTHCDKFYVKN